MSIHGTNVAEEHGIRRSPHWATEEKHFLIANHFCLSCSKEKKYERGLQVHHAVMPFHFCILLGRPELELDPRNLAVFCEDENGVETQDHHILVGHAGFFQSYMPDAARLATTTFFKKTKAEILAMPIYQKLSSNRPKTWAQLSDSEKKAMRKMLDKALPKK